MRTFPIRAVLMAGIVLPLLLLAAAPLPGQGNKNKKDKPKPPPDYYPLKVGNAWQYRVGKDQVTVRVAKEEQAEKETVAVLETSGGGKALTERVSAQKDGLYRLTAEDMEIRPALCFLKLPFKAGDTWTVKGSAGDLPVEGTFTAAEEEVAVPAGKYRTATATCPDLRIGKARMALKYWFAPGVGMVKQRLQIGDRVVLVELEKFTPAK